MTGNIHTSTRFCPVCGHQRSTMPDSVGMDVSDELYGCGECELWLSKAAWRESCRNTAYLAIVTIPEHRTGEVVRQQVAESVMNQAEVLYNDAWWNLAMPMMRIGVQELSR